MNRHDGSPAFLVCGSPRTGTRFLATVLRQAGLNVGHEGWWCILKVWPERGLDGDVSCLGTFDLAYGGRVLAQVRNPRRAIPSLHRDLVGYGWHSTMSFYRAVAPSCTGDPALDAARIWTSFTRMAVERAERWWRVEEVTPDLLVDVFGVSEPAATDALAAVPTDTNHRPFDKRIDYPWPDHEAIEEALELGRSLGY